MNGAGKAVYRSTEKEHDVIRHRMRQLIAERAFAIYESRQESGEPGTAEGDWLQAEKELDQDA